MTSQDLLDTLTRAGLRIRRDGDDLDVEGPASIVTPRVLDQIRRNKTALLRLLVDAPLGTTPPPPRDSLPLTFCETHNRQLVDGEVMAGVCWWCEPDRAPQGHAIHSLNADELARLAVVVRGTP